MADLNNSVLLGPRAESDCPQGRSVLDADVTLQGEDTDGIITCTSSDWEARAI